MKVAAESGRPPAWSEGSLPAPQVIAEDADAVTMVHGETALATTASYVETFGAADTVDARRAERRLSLGAALLFWIVLSLGLWAGIIALARALFF